MRILINRKLTILFSCIFLILQGCSSKSDSNSNQNTGILPPVSSGSNIGSVTLRARAVFTVSTSPDQKNSLVLTKKSLQTCSNGNCVDSTDVTVTNEANTQFALNLSNIPNNAFSTTTNNQNLKNFLTLDIGTLFDNDLMVCSNQKCDTAQIRAYTANNLGLYNSATQQSIPLFIQSQYLSPMTQIPVGSNQGLVIDQESIPSSQHVISLNSADFSDSHGTNGGYQLFANFSQAGAGIFQAQVIVEYDLASTQNPETSISILPQSANLASNGFQSFSALGGIGPLTYSLIPNILLSTPSSLVDNGNGDAVYTAGVNSTTQLINETVIVSDGSGDTIQAVVSISPALQTIPASQSLAFASSTNIIAEGGVPPYTYAVTQGTGTLNGNIFTSPSAIETDIVTVTDASGSSVSETITPVPTATGSNDSLVANFGQSGLAAFSVGQSAGQMAYVIQTQQDSTSGSIYVFGANNNSSANWFQDLYIQKMLPSGQIDPSYGTNGQAVVNLSSLSSILDPTNTSNASVTPQTVMISGNYIYILVVDNVYSPIFQQSYYLMRTDLSGNIDQAYGNNTALVQLTLPTSSYGALGYSISAMTLSPQGFVVIGGANNASFLTSYDFNGALISSFGSGGLALLNDPSCPSGQYFNSVKKANLTNSLYINYYCANNSGNNSYSFAKVSLTDGTATYGDPSLANYPGLNFQTQQPSNSFILDPNDNVLSWSFINEPSVDGNGNPVGVQILKLKSDLSTADSSYGPNGDGTSAIEISPDDMSQQLSDFILINNNYYAVDQNCIYSTNPPTCFADTYSFTQNGSINYSFANASLDFPPNFSYLNVVNTIYKSPDGNILVPITGGDPNYNSIYDFAEISSQLNPSLPILAPPSTVVVLGNTQEQIGVIGGSSSTFTYSVIAGAGTIDSSGNFSSNSTGTSTVMAVDSSGNATTEDIIVEQFVFSQGSIAIDPTQSLDLSSLIVGSPIGALSYVIQGTPNGTLNGSVYNTNLSASGSDTIIAADHANPPNTATIVININPSIAISLSESPAMSADNVSVSASGGNSNYTYSISSTIGSTISGSEVTVGVNISGSVVNDVITASDGFIQTQIQLPVTPTPPVTVALGQLSNLAIPLNTQLASESTTSPQPGALITLTPSGGFGYPYTFTMNSQIGSHFIDFRNVGFDITNSAQYNATSMAIDSTDSLSIQIGTNNTGAAYSEILTVTDVRGITGTVIFTVPAAPLSVSPLMAESLISGAVVDFNLLFGTSSGYSSALTSNSSSNGSLASLSSSSWAFTPDAASSSDVLSSFNSTDGQTSVVNYVMNRGAVKKLIASVGPINDGAGGNYVTTEVPAFCFIDQNNDLYCWGQQSSNSALNYTSATPTKVQGLTSTVVDAAILVDNYSQSYGILAVLADGTVWVQGMDGAGITLANLRASAFGMGNVTEAQTYSTMTQITSLSNVKSISSANDIGYTCMVINDGTVQCINPNYFNQVGPNLGSTSGLSNFENDGSPVTISGISNTNKVVVSDAGYGCALKNDGSVSCWGEDFMDTIYGFGIFTLTVPSTSEITPGNSRFSGSFYFYEGVNLLALNAAPVSDLALSDQGACFLINNSVSCIEFSQYSRLVSNTLQKIYTPAAGNTILKLYSSPTSGAFCATGIDSNNNPTSNCWGMDYTSSVGGTFPVSGLNTNYQTTPVSIKGYTQLAFSDGNDSPISCGVNGSNVECWGSNNLAGNLFGTVNTSSFPTAFYGYYMNETVGFVQGTANYSVNPIVIFNAADY